MLFDTEDEATNHAIVHLDTETGHGQYFCSDCDNRFPVEAALTADQLSAHGGHMEPEFPRPNCSETILDGETCEEHVKALHSELSPGAGFDCVSCGENYGTGDALADHKRTKHISEFNVEQQVALLRETMGAAQAAHEQRRREEQQWQREHEQRRRQEQQSQREHEEREEQTNRAHRLRERGALEMEMERNMAQSQLFKSQAEALRVRNREIGEKWARLA
ncbi:hypothetical protein LTR37_016905 [Vermiconidia calcicola]|uniref:Uncharacterized protein n=1 Tax=Vermiconidia calcicola TaxID=1690605 RepID=A0ACC3MLI0_9PEZI|nr:hypothetical protein LTR37_016905 [Vermiconidia calcicola]